jgi:hypothetical protein
MRFKDMIISYHSMSLSFSSEMTSIVVESNITYNEQPFPNNFHQQSSFTLEVSFKGLVIIYILVGITMEGQYANHLD